MNRNQKIAIGCGGLGCLGLLVCSIALGAFMYWRSHQSRVDVVDFRDRPGPSTSNSNSNRNTNSGSNNSADSDSSTSTVSNDDKHKLFQAAGMTKDQELMVKVMKKVGLFKPDNTPADDYPQFIKDHLSWAVENRDFINSVNTPEKAKAYIDAHFED